MVERRSRYASPFNENLADRHGLQASHPAVPALEKEDAAAPLGTAAPWEPRKERRGVC
jgi:hypothetical protein